MNESNRHGVARIGVVPVRNTPSETSEMVNQLLLGETMRIVSGDEVWTRVVADFDGYEGWVSSNQITSLTSSEFEEWTQHPARKRFPFTVLWLYDRRTDMYRCRPVLMFHSLKTG